MYAQIEKPKNNKSRPVVNSVVQKNSTGKQGFSYVDISNKRQCNINRLDKQVLQLKRYIWNGNAWLAEKELLPKGKIMPPLKEKDAPPTWPGSYYQQIFDSNWADNVKTGHVVYNQHPDWPTLHHLITSAGYTIQIQDDQDPQTVNSKTGKRVIKVRENTNFLDLEHEFNHLLQYRRASNSRHDKYIEDITWIENDVYESEAYLREWMRLEAKGGHPEQEKLKIKIGEHYVKKLMPKIKGDGRSKQKILKLVPELEVLFENYTNLRRAKECRNRYHDHTK